MLRQANPPGPAGSVPGSVVGSGESAKSNRVDAPRPGQRGRRIGGVCGSNSASPVAGTIAHGSEALRRRDEHPAGGISAPAGAGLRAQQACCGGDRSVGGLRHAAALRDASTPALDAPITPDSPDSQDYGSGLSLVKIGRLVPGSLDLSNAGLQDRSVALIAEVLLNAGVLQETDYIGALRECVNIGLRRWSADFGCENLSHFDDLGLAWGDNIAAVGLYDDVWYQRCVLDKPVTMHTSKEQKIGYFALTSTSHDDLDASGAEALVIGPRIESLMGIVGGAAAWRVCRVLQSALGTSGIALTPASIREMPGDDYLNYDEDWCDGSPESEERDIMTTSRFDRGQPVEACEWCRDEDARLLRRDRAKIKRQMQAEWSLEKTTDIHPSLTQILAMSGRSVGGHYSAITWAFNVLAVAADLGTLLERRFLNVGEGAVYRHMLNPISMMHPRTLPSHVVRWSMADNVERVFDDYWNRMLQDEATPLTTVLPFVIDLPGNEPGTLFFAVEALRELIPIVTLCDALLDLLHEMDTPASEGGTGVWPLGTKRPGQQKAVVRQRIQIGVPTGFTSFTPQNPLREQLGASFEPRSAVDAMRLQQQAEAARIERFRSDRNQRVAAANERTDAEMMLQDFLDRMETDTQE